MPASLVMPPSSDFADPRLQPDFQPAHWPLCNGGDAPPPGACDPHERRCLEFLAAFYRLNSLNGQLLAARTAAADHAVTRPILEQIAAATSALERLEDRYAPIGFYGEPVLDGGRYSSIGFIRPALPRTYRQHSSVSSHITIPGLADIPASELKGQINVIHLEHGKIDFGKLAVAR